MNFIGKWKTRDGSQASIVRQEGDLYIGFVSDETLYEHCWDLAGNYFDAPDFETRHTPGLDLMERISGFDKRKA